MKNGTNKDKSYQKDILHLKSTIYVISLKNREKNINMYKKLLKWSYSTLS